METFFKDELIFYTSDEFSDRVLCKNGVVVKVSWEDLNEKYNSDEFNPVDGRLVRIADHLSALMEADISIKHGITSEHLESGRDGMKKIYPEGEIVSGINVNELFKTITD